MPCIIQKCYIFTINCLKVKTNFTMKLKFLHARFLSAFVFVLASLSSIAVFAQPANDLCSGAIELTLGGSEATAVYTAGTTVGTVDGATTPGPSVCSGNFYRDDVWYKFTIPADSTGKAITVRVNNAVVNGLSPVGMAIYTSNVCDATNAPYLCTNFTATDDARFKFSTDCAGVGKEILVRVWSAVGGANDWATGEGNFEVSAFYTDDNSATPTLWGDNGEGSFDGGKGAWTTTSASCNGFELWQWSNTDFCTKGAFSTGGGLINSLTNCNGAMCFDSDYYDNGGDGANAGAGPCPAPQSGTLESPIIDLSGFPTVTGVNLVFSQALRKFQSMFFIDYSIDGGANWAPIEINTEAEDPVLYPVNSPHVNNIRRIFLPGAAGQAQVKVRFRFEANYYYWIIDDVKITERESFNLKANAFAAIAPNKVWQHDQLEPFGGLIDISNIGANPMPGTSVSLDIKDATNTTIWSDELSYGTTAADSTYENNPMTAVFTHPNDNLTSYSGTYTVSGDNPDFDITDNTQAFSWSVSDSTMSKENAATVGSGVRPSTGFNYTWGNIYHIVNNKNSNDGKTYRCNYVSVGISNPDALEGATMFVYLYKWDNEDADDVAQATERTTVGFAQFDFPAGESANTLYTLPISDFNTFDSGVALEANTDYILAVEYTTPPDKPDLEFFIGSDGNIDYTAQTLRSTLPGLGPIRYSHVLDVGNTGDYNASTFTGGTTPIVRMHLSTKTISTNEPKLDDANKLVVAPNPVKKDLNLKIDLVKEAKNATIEIMDINGKILSVRQLNNVKNSIERFDVSNYANGSYILNYKSADGVRAVQFIVAN